MTLLAWTVVKTRWPVSADWIAICAVSMSRDLADHDLVRVVAEDAPQAALRRSAFFSLTGIGSPRGADLDRVLDGDDLVLVVADSLSAA